MARCVYIEVLIRRKGLREVTLHYKLLPQRVTGVVLVPLLIQPPFEGQLLVGGMNHGLEV